MSLGTGPGSEGHPIGTAWEWVLAQGHPMDMAWERVLALRGTTEDSSPTDELMGKLRHNSSYQTVRGVRGHRSCWLPLLHWEGG